jgi:SPP1 gp7 family putative phage head morphogenesis protein
MFIFPGQRRRRRVPRQLRPSMIELDYTRSLLRLVDRVRLAFAQVISEAPALLESAALERADDARADAGEADRLRQLIAQARDTLIASLPVRELEQLAVEVARRTEGHQKTQLIRQVRAKLGVDVLLTDPRLGSIMEGFVAENVSLIKSVPEEIAARLEKTVTRGVSSGLRWRDIAEDVQADFDVGRQRAHVIARDQVGKFYGQVSQTRQKDLGATEYIWRTARDGRVRGNPTGNFPKAKYSHWDREGVRFRWDEPPPDGHPGQPILCRCYPEPVLDHLLG